MHTFLLGFSEQHFLENIRRESKKKVVELITYSTKRVLSDERNDYLYFALSSPPPPPPPPLSLSLSVSPPGESRSELARRGSREEGSS